MSHTVVEMAAIRLKADITEADLLAASDQFQQTFLSQAQGFVRRELLRLSGPDYLDVIHWRSESDAQSVMAAAAGSPECAAYFAVMDMDGAGPDSGVRHYASLATYLRG